MNIQENELNKIKISGRMVSPSVFSALAISHIFGVGAYFYMNKFRSPDKMIRKYKTNRMIKKPRKWRRILRRRNAKKNIYECR